MKKFTIILNLIAMIPFIYLAIVDTYLWLIMSAGYVVYAFCWYVGEISFSLSKPNILIVLFAVVYGWIEYQGIVNDDKEPQILIYIFLVFASIVAICNLITSNIIYRELKASVEENENPFA